MSVSVRVETKSKSGAGGQRSHDLRIGDKPNYVDRSRGHLNSTVIPYLTPQQLSKDCLDRRVARAQTQGAKRQPRSMKRDATIMIAGIITFGKEAQLHIRNLPDEEQNELFRQTAELVAKELGTTVAGLVVHRDESAPHAHFQLPGYGIDGSPISKKINLPMCSKIQDIGAKPFNKYKIYRGERVTERRERGDDYSKTIHRSVRQLHSDLPKELEAAREKVAEMEIRVGKTETKLHQVREKLNQEQANNRDLKSKNSDLEKDRQRLEKRLKAYEKRLADRTSELTRLSEIGKKKPTVETGTLVELSSRALFGGESIKSKKEIKYIPAEDINLWFGGVVERANLSKKKEKEALERATEAETRVDRLQQAIEPLLLDTATVGRPTQTQITRIAAKAEFETYYSVIVQRTSEMVRVPPQKDKSSKQVAAALYRSSRENFDPKSIQFRVSSDEIAEEVIRMAIEDDHVMNVSFQDLNHQSMLQEASEKALKEGRMGKQPVIGKATKTPSELLSDTPSWDTEENPGLH